MLVSISLILSIAAIVISILAFRHSKRQLEFMKERESVLRLEAESLRTWEQKFNDSVNVVLKVGPPFIHTAGGLTNTYHVYFQPLKCGSVLKRTWSTTLTLTLRRGDQPSDVLGMDIVRRTITEVLECAELFKHADPGNANNLGLKTHNGARFPSELIQLRL